MDLVTNFYNEIKDKNKDLGIFNSYPNLVYNTDETGLISVPSTSQKVIAPKGQKTVQN